MRSVLVVDDLLRDFVERELLPGTGIGPKAFWTALERILADFTPRNSALLARRDELQAKIAAWWLKHRGKPDSLAARRASASIGWSARPGQG